MAATPTPRSSRRWSGRGVRGPEDKTAYVSNWHEGEAEGGQSQFGLAPVVQASTCSAMARASSTSMPRYLMISLRAMGWCQTMATYNKWKIGRLLKFHVKIVSSSASCRQYGAPGTGLHTDQTARNIHQPALATRGVKRPCGHVLWRVVQLPRSSAPAHHRAPGIRRRGSMFPPIVISRICWVSL
jgi:hypothetical protein